MRVDFQRKIIIAQVVITSLVLIIFFGFIIRDMKTRSAIIDENKIREKMDSIVEPLRKENARLVSDNADLYIEIKALKKEDTAILSRIHESNQNMKQITKKYNEKISAIDRLSNAELVDFFSDRYK